MRIGVAYFQDSLGLAVKRISVVMAVFALMLVPASPLAGGAEAAEAGTVELTISNFRYCEAASCTPTDQGYVRSDSGPVAGSDNPAGIIDVPAGSTVQWVYRDAFCDSIEECSGHNVVFEDGTSEGTTAGFARARNGPSTISATITQQPGDLIRYFCSVNDHYQSGMTGILRVVASGGG